MAILEFIPILSSILILGINMMVFAGMIKRERVKYVKRTPNVSIIVAAWNEGNRIARCIKSLIDLEYPKNKREIIVVGGGTDNTSKICKKFAKLGDIKFLEEKERGGKWFALNKGIDKAKYGYVAFTDADCVVNKDWLNKMASHRGADIVISPAISLHDKGLVGKCFHVSVAYLSLAGHSLTRIFNASAFSGLGSFMRKKIAKKIKFQNSLVEDYKFCQKAIEKGYRLGIDLNAPVYSAQPRTFGDWRKSLVRIFYGFLNEMLFLKDRVSLMLLTIGMFTIIGGAIAFIAEINVTTLLITNAILFLVSVSNLIIVSKVYKSTKYILHLPYLVLFYIIVQIFATEGFLRWIFRRNMGWPIYNKI